MLHGATCECSTCGSTTAILDYGYLLPDCIWEQPEAERSTRNMSSFAEMSGRWFIRGLMPVKLAHGDEFRYGLWLEVNRDVFDQVRDVWDDESRYPALRFVATIANAAPPWGQRLLGAEVEVGVRDPNARPYVFGARAAWLQDVLVHGWTASEYDAVVTRLTGPR